MKKLQQLRDQIADCVVDLKVERSKLASVKTEIKENYNIKPDEIENKLKGFLSKRNQLQEKLNRRKKSLKNKLQRYEIL